MVIKLEFENKKYQVDLSNGFDISIPLVHEAIGPKCFYAPNFKIEPVVDGSFIGSINAGSPVNFKNLFMNPHGNGTHTECVGHILAGHYTINQCLKKFHFVSRVISVTPELLENGDLIVTKNMIQKSLMGVENTEVLILRSLPNSIDKTTKDYSGTNPPYFSIDAMEALNVLGVRHLMTDLPSVDREVDGGKLSSHHTFWETNKEVASGKTITEMIFVPDSIVDGLYFCNIQIASIESDASPSKIMLYDLVD
jgi:kynurenine formamidase